jgi:hypothetical protein
MGTRQTIKCYFADSKKLHGLRYARYRWLAKIREQCFLIAMTQNVKKWPYSFGREEKFLKSTLFAIFNFLYLYFPETYNPWPFSCEKSQGFVINLAFPYEKPFFQWRAFNGVAVEFSPVHSELPDDPVPGHAASGSLDTKENKSLGHGGALIHLECEVESTCFSPLFLGVVCPVPSRFIWSIQKPS